MTMTLTEQPSYKPKQGFSKFGNLKANLNLDMHKPNKDAKEYIFKKVKTFEPIEDERDEDTKSASIIQFGKIRNSLARKREIKAKFQMPRESDEPQRPIRISKSKRKVNAGTGGSFDKYQLKIQQSGEIEVIDNNPSPDSESEEKEQIKNLMPNKKSNKVESKMITDDSASESVKMRTTVVKMTETNEIEISKLTQKEISDTRLVQPVNNNFEPNVFKRTKNVAPIKIEISLTDTDDAMNVNQIKSFDEDAYDKEILQDDEKDNFQSFKKVFMMEEINDTEEELPVNLRNMNAQNYGSSLKKKIDRYGSKAKVKKSEEKIQESLPSSETPIITQFNKKTASKKITEEEILR